MQAFACRVPRAVVRVVIGCYTSRTYLAPWICPAEHEIVLDHGVRDIRVHRQTGVGRHVVNSVIKYRTVGGRLIRRAAELNTGPAVRDDVVANRYAVVAVKRSALRAASPRVNRDLLSLRSKCRIVNEIALDQYLLVRVRCGIGEIDTITTPAKPADIAEPDGEISDSVLAIDPVALSPVRAGMIDHKILDQNIVVLIAVRCLKGCWGIWVDRAEIKTFSIGAFDAKIMEDQVCRRPRDNLRCG